MVYIKNADISLHINDDVLTLMTNNSNLKNLELYFPLKLPAHTVCDSASFDFLAELLGVFINYKHTLLNIQLPRQSSEFDVFLHFAKISAGNEKPETEFTITIHNTNACNYNVTQQILTRLPKQLSDIIVVRNYGSILYM